MEACECIRARQGGVKLPRDEGSRGPQARATYTKPAAAAATSNTDSNPSSSGAGGHASRAGSGHQPKGVEANLADYPLVRWAVTQVSDPPDRSRDTACVLRACYDSGLTLQEAAWAVRTRQDLAERLNDRSDVELSRNWLETDTGRWLRARVRGGLPGLPVTPVRSLCEMPVQQVISDRCTHRHHTTSKTKDRFHPGRRGEGRTPKPARGKSRCQCKGTSRREH
jgi:hypothetical protein